MYHPTGRVLSVLEWLQSSTAVSGPELAERLETDVRTVRRYIQKLQDVGIPIESIPGRFGGYTLRPGYRLPPLIFSEDETMAVILGLVGSPWLRLSLPKDSVESALSKITRVLPQTTWDRVQSLSAVSILGLDPGGPQVPPATLLRLSGAVENQRCVSLDYRSQTSTSRIVEPYSLGGFQGHWYMVGFCRLRKAMRLFRLDRVASFEVLETSFERPKDFSMDVYMKAGLESQRWKIHLWFDAAENDIRRLLGKVGQVTPVDGGHEYRGASDDLNYTAQTLLFSEISFRVLGPPELKQTLSRLAEKARQAAEGLV